MKILQINAIYGCKSTGIIVKDIDFLLQYSGYESYIAYQNATEEPLFGYKIGNSIDYKMHAFLTRLLGKQAYFSTTSTKSLIKYINEIQPDIVHLHNLHNNYLNLNLLLEYLAKKSINTVITLHDCWFFTGKCFHYQIVECYKWKALCGKCPQIKTDVPSWLFDRTNSVLIDKNKYFSKLKSLTIVGVSKWISNEAKHGIFKDKDIITIYNGVNIDVFKPTFSQIREELGLLNKFIILGAAAKWLSHFNMETLNYIVSNIKSDMKLVIFGCNKEELKQLSESVVGIGYITDRDEMAKIYSFADVFVNVTFEDSLPTVNMEALACGTPVITYDSGGSSEIINQETGLIVPKGNKEELLKAILKIKAKGKNFYEQKCIDRVTKNFNKNDRYQEYVNLYLNILKRGRN